MRRKLHDGPSEFVITGGRIKPPPLKPVASIAALQWAADRAGRSYGQFCLGLRREDEARIQAEFEAWMREREEEQAARAKARAEAESEGLSDVLPEDDAQA